MLPTGSSQGGRLVHFCLFMQSSADCSDQCLGESLQRYGHLHRAHRFLHGLGNVLTNWIVRALKPQPAPILVVPNSLQRLCIRAEALIKKTCEGARSEPRSSERVPAGAEDAGKDDVGAPEGGAVIKFIHQRALGCERQWDAELFTTYSITSSAVTRSSCSNGPIFSSTAAGTHSRWTRVDRVLNIVKITLSEKPFNELRTATGNRAQVLWDFLKPALAMPAGDGQLIGRSCCCILMSSYKQIAPGSGL